MAIDESTAKIIWDNMPDNHRRYVIARLVSKSDAEASKKIGLNYQTIVSWANKKLLDEYIEYQRRETLQAAKLVILESALEAAGVLRDKLKSRQALTAAKEILDRAGLPATTRQEIGGIGGGVIEVRSVDYRNGITAIEGGPISSSDAPGKE